MRVVINRYDPLCKMEFDNVERWSDPVFLNDWFWVEKKGTKRYIRASDIESIYIEEDE